MKEIKMHNGFVALIDDEDFEKVNKYKWHVGDGYAKTAIKINGKYVIYQMHRLIMNIGFKEKALIDHVDRNRLNNQKCNLRICSNQQNSQNRGLSSSNKWGFKGVYFHKASQKFYATIMKDGKAYYIGVFSTPEEAAREYDKAAIEHYGEFACTNESLGLFNKESK